MRFTIFIEESGDVKVHSNKAIDLYELAVPFDTYDTKMFEEEIHLKGKYTLRNGKVYENWHVFKILDWTVRGYHAHVKVEYVHSEELDRITDELIEVYTVDE